MVVSAEQDGVGEAGVAAVGPGDDVVAVAPGRGPVAAGNAQPRSRRLSARRSDPVNRRWARPRSRTCPAAPRTAGMRWQSQARMRAAVADRMPPSSRVACPSWSVRVRSGTVTTTWGRCPPWSGSWSPVRARRASSMRASARRWAGVRMSRAPSAAGMGADSGSRAVRSTAAASVVSRPRSQCSPCPSSIMVNSRRCVARCSARASCSASSRSRVSGATTSRMCRPSRVSSAASNRSASPIRCASARRRTSGPASSGNASTARTIAAACG